MVFVYAKPRPEKAASDCKIYNNYSFQTLNITQRMETFTLVYIAVNFCDMNIICMQHLRKSNGN